MGFLYCLSLVLLGCLGTTPLTADPTAVPGPQAVTLPVDSRSAPPSLPREGPPGEGSPDSLPTRAVPEDCLEALRTTLFLPSENENASNSLYWAATGKPTDGATGGPLLWIGQFDVCVSIGVSQRLAVIDGERNADFRGRYCLADLVLDRASNLPYPANNQSSTLVRWGICVPDICNSSQISEHISYIFTETLHFREISVEQSYVNCATDPPVSKGLKVTLAIMGFLLGLVILGTAADLAHKYKVSHHPKLVYRIDTAGSHLVCPDGTPDETSPLLSGASTASSSNPSTSTASATSHVGADSWGIQVEPDVWNRPPNASRLRYALRQQPGRLIKVSQCFSLVSNCQEVFRIDCEPPTVRCLHSLRVLSSMWVVLGHTMLVLYNTQLVDNSDLLESYTKHVSWQVVPSAFLAGDTFFFLSGLLVAYVSLKSMEKRSGRLFLGRFYARRYIRLTPLVLVVMLLWMYVVPHLGSGPIWYHAQDKSACFRSWWTNLLYIQNFYPVHFGDICLPWTWYLALDVQFYVFSPILLHALYRGFKKGLMAACVMVAMSLLTTASLIGYFNISVNVPASILTKNTSALDDYLSIVFDKPYVRVPPYIVGMVTGYLLQRHTDRHNLTQKGKLKVLFAWMLAMASCFCLVYGLFPTFLGFPLGLSGNIIYGTLSHVCWSLALAWIVYASHRGYGGVIGDLLSWHGWIPLSRVTYAVYLIHPVVIHVYNYSHKTAIHISDYYIGLYYCGLLLVCYAGALFLTLVVEQPIISIGRCLRPRHRSVEETD